MLAVNTAANMSSPICSVTKEWIMPEKFCDPCRSVFVIAGRKFSLLGHEDDEVQPTLHRVRLPYGVQRNTMLYFQDLPA